MHERITVNGFTHDRRAYEHEYQGDEVVTRREGEANVCTCGLVTEVGADLLQSLGAVDPVPPRSNAPAGPSRRTTRAQRRSVARVAELVREQDAGRITSDQLYETLRRDFPLR